MPSASNKRIPRTGKARPRTLEDQLGYCKNQRGTTLGFMCLSGINKCHPFGGDKTRQMHDKFEGFPFNNALFRLAILLEEILHHQGCMKP